MNKEQIISELCAMASALSEIKDSNAMPHDCFCSLATERDDYPFFKFDPAIIEFFRDAIAEKLERDHYGDKKSSRFLLNSRNTQ